jgi:hypothetical protein
MELKLGDLQHLAVDSKIHEAICANLSLNNVTNAEVFPGFIMLNHRKIKSVAADKAYDAGLCLDDCTVMTRGAIFCIIRRNLLHSATCLHHAKERANFGISRD